MKKICAVMLLMVLLVTLASCRVNRRGGEVSGWDDKAYQIGDAEITDVIDTIDIGWSSGSVTVVPAKGKNITLTEVITGTVTDEKRMHWQVEGKTLRIRYSAPGMNITLPMNCEKRLTVAVPENVQLTGLSISSASAQVNVEGIAADRMALASASGRLDITADARDMSISTASGKVVLKQQGTMDSLALSTASGKVEADLAHVKDAAMSSASGSFVIKAGAAETLTVQTASGKINCSFASTPKKVRLECTSGDVTLAMPEANGFTARVETGSGSFDTGIAVRKQGKTYLCGDGKAEIDISTTSGDVFISQSK
ncbi:MAG: DUF4097 family beta strand repeat-containing protein [Clostridia bacterium]|nr:DUF4097 family beta strand repeat-containing protein [Clostridia bacterium]